MDTHIGNLSDLPCVPIPVEEQGVEAKCPVDTEGVNISLEPEVPGQESDSAIRNSERSKGVSFQTHINLCSSSPDMNKDEYLNTSGNSGEEQLQEEEIETAATGNLNASEHNVAESSSENNAKGSVTSLIDLSEIQDLQTSNSPQDKETERKCNLKEQQHQQPNLVNNNVLNLKTENNITMPAVKEPFEKAEGSEAGVILDSNDGKNEDPEVIHDVEMTEQLDQPILWPYVISDDFRKKEKFHCLATTAKDEFKGRNLKGCKWAPDGSCLLSNSDDNLLRLYNLPQSVYKVNDWSDSYLVEEDESWNPALVIREGGQIYDYTWFPLMNSSDCTSSCFLSTACDEPIHLRDAFTGSLRASYLPYNQYDEVTSAYSVAFDPYGQYIYSGFNQTVRIFNITRPGRECTVRTLKHKVLPDLCQKGIISCIAVNPTLNGVYACGSYRRTVGLYLEDGAVLCMLEGHLGGVTHMTFSHDGSKLYTGGRKDSRLICWDMRNMGEEYKIFDRVSETNQRIYFDLTRNDRYLTSGGSDGFVLLWDLASVEDEPIKLNISTDCVNGVSFNPFVPILATSSGMRHFPDISENGDSDELFVDSTSKKKEAKEIKLWKFV